LPYATCQSSVLTELVRRATYSLICDPRRYMPLMRRGRRLSGLLLSAILSDLQLRRFSIRAWCWEKLLKIPCRAGASLIARVIWRSWRTVALVAC